MNKIWTETTALGRIEMGFYIYYDLEKEIYYIGKKMIGELITNPLTTASLELRDPSPQFNNVPTDAVLVGLFHNHTPVDSTLSSKHYREVGPSDDDQHFVSKHQITGFVMDFIGESNPNYEQNITRPNDKSGTEIYIY